MERINPLRNKLVDRYRKFCKRISDMGKIHKPKKPKTIKKFRDFL